MNDIKMNSKYIYLMKCNLYNKKYSDYLSIISDQEDVDIENREIL
jgi:hypothetical protein